MASATKQLKPGVWTDEEDALLALWQGQVGNRWSEVAKNIPGKTGQQCAQRWRHRVNPDISREKWSYEEDSRLAGLVERHGNSWAEIARRLPGRTDQQCMGRWRRHLDPSIRREGWGAEEDEQLRELFAEYGSSWSCISKSMSGRTAQQCRARWCQLSNAERPSRSSASRSTSTSTATGAQTLELEGIVNPRRQSTANTYGGSHQAAALAAAGAAPNPLAFFAVASAEGAPLAAAAATVAGSDGAGQWAAPRGAAASRRLSTVPERVGARELGWNSGASSSGMEEEEDEDDKEGEASPEFTIRKTTARTASRTASRTAAVTAAPGPPLLPKQQLQQQQHHHLQPPAVSAAAPEVQVPTPTPSAAVPAAAPAVVLPEALLPLKLELPAAGYTALDEDEDSPALTHNHATAAQGTAPDLMSPMRCHLPPAPPLFTPSSSGRKRPAAMRMASFSLPPLVIPDTAAAAAARTGTPVRMTPGSGPMSLEQRSPNVLTLLQSPQPLLDDLFRSPGFGSLVTPPWAKSGTSNGSAGSARAAAAALTAAAIAAAAASAAAGAEDEDRRQSVARRLDAAAPFGETAAVPTDGGLGQLAGGANATGGAGAAGLSSLASFDFGLVMGSPLKKTKLCSPPGSSLTMATAPWTMGAAASGLRLQQQQQHSDSGGGTSLAMAVQQHLLLASTAKAGPGPAAAASALPSYRESGLAARQLTLTGGKPPAPAAVAVAASPARQQLTSSSVRMRLHALLDSA
ncbi:hypothetical protein D9Q98_009947 [Chlorella vulgaris]|uniref:Uncharacterized protein n=1 Tax=Chlorella vulgaris TaxID=3077 RepID=A0A9D4TFU4_CHLVU|nr:hypothetical protein D9Q98_009947 [Chlorella vulgaris]